MKKRIGLMVCCLILIGSFAVGVLPVQAAVYAVCKHPHFRLLYGVKYRNVYTTEGHYEDVGTKNICADCGYVWWTNLERVKTGTHNWELKCIGTDINGDKVWEYQCAGCGWSKPY